MVVLFEILILVGVPALVVAGIFATDWVRLHASQQALESTVFNAVLPLAVEAGEQKKAIEATVDRPQVSVAEVEEYVAAAQLPYALKKRATAITVALSKATDAEGLSVEDEHNLNVVAEQLFSSVRLFESLPETRQNSREVLKELTSQLELLSSAVQNIVDSNSETVVRQLRTATEFLKMKFASNSFTLKK